ncbi:dolichyl-diphosphooligosaccharide--protein glycosyltransferase subunit DAD1-like isoform X2 [Zingiber officinale]|uniref:dolichyl-diphosphooligosaccharide--protein glycosyltransferase subunit DAD1-like isoform X2 n=1 Tax=Zingiber officinale TaxID=94328 RepID=UPI001C4D2EE3|nr:dolichyl-diphosphooligosaccharide--protein glycosyltransferase subunit DAD1-like isoform X2 [Zingiber officinale]
MAKSSTSDAQALFRSLRSAYAATPTNLKIIDLYVVYAITTAVIQVVYMGIVGSFPFNSFLAGVLSCVGTAVLAVCLRIQVNKENKEFKNLVCRIYHPNGLSLISFFATWCSTSW